MSTKHRPLAIAPAEEPVIRLGNPQSPKKFTLRYTLRSRLLIGERHGSIEAFVADLVKTTTGEADALRLDVTVILAGLCHVGMTEETLDRLVGADIEQVREASHVGFRAMSDAFGWGAIFDFKDDEDDTTSGEAEAGESPAEED